MIFYRFHEKDGHLVAITNDITGSSLPKAAGGWRADGQTEIKEGGAKRLGTDPKEIIATIEREGLFIGTVHNA